MGKSTEDRPVTIVVQKSNVSSTASTAVISPCYAIEDLQRKRTQRRDRQRQTNIADSRENRSKQRVCVSVANRIHVD